MLDAIYKRRSIRKFIDKPVPNDVVRQIITAGTWAPSAGNMQAWEFIVVQDAEARRKVVDTTSTGTTARGGVHTQEWMLTSPDIIIVCYNVKRMRARYRDRGEKLAMLDCMGCVQNILLASMHFGLGSCCVNGFDPQRLKEALSIPKEITPLLLVPVGYAAYVPCLPYRLPFEDLVRLVV